MGPLHIADCSNIVQIVSCQNAIKKKRIYIFKINNGKYAYAIDFNETFFEQLICF